MANKFHLRIITPNRIMFEDDVEMVIMKTNEGDLGILANHSPLTTTLDYGIFKIINDSTTKEASILGGFAKILNNNVMIISDIAEWSDEIDVKRAEEAKDRAERRMHNSTESYDFRKAELAFRRASVRLEVSSYSIIKGRVSSSSD